MNTPTSLLRHLVVLAALAIAYPLSSAENPVHTPPTREAVNPLYEGRNDAASLAPLTAWVKQRCADGTCTAETLQREMQTVLADIHERATKGHRILLDDIKAARTAREALLKEIAAAKAGSQPVRALADRVAKLPALPARAWGDPHVDQITASSAKRTAMPSSAGVSGTTADRTVTTASSAQASAGDLDIDGIAEKLKGDLAALTSLAQQTQLDLQAATTRMQKATAELARQSKAMHDVAKNAIQNMKG